VAPAGKAQVVAKPVWVSIPAIGIKKTKLIRLGLTRQGTLQVPKTTTVAGWFTGGPRPGAVGSAVIAGHVDSKTGPGIFFWLRALKPGDKVYVGRADGTMAIAVWNYAEPGEEGATREFELRLSRGGAADVTILDEQHGSALTEWRKMGEPAFPSREQQQALRAAGRLPSPIRMPIEQGSLRLTLAPRALALIEIAP